MNCARILPRSLRSCRLEDDASLLLRYKGGARGVLCASQILAGEENDFNIRVYGTEASLEWHQENPDHLIVKHPDTPRQVVRRGGACSSSPARLATRLPSGAPEAFIEAFANIYREAARAIRVEVNGDLIPEDLDFPTVDDVNHGGKLVEDTIEFAANSIPPVRIGETVRVYAVALEA